QGQAGEAADRGSGQRHGDDQERVQRGDAGTAGQAGPAHGPVAGASPRRDDQPDAGQQDQASQNNDSGLDRPGPGPAGDQRGGPAGAHQRAGGHQPAGDAAGRGGRPGGGGDPPPAAPAAGPTRREAGDDQRRLAELGDRGPGGSVGVQPLAQVVQVRLTEPV